MDINSILEQFISGIVAFIPNLIVSLIIFVLGLYLGGLLSRAANRWVARRNADRELVRILEMIVKWTVIILGTTMALNQIGFNLTAFLAGLGIVGFTIGFAIQDVSKNFVAGLLLLIEQPFQIGDTIEVKGYGGTVLNVHLRATEMRTYDGRIVQIPNADIFTSPIVNFTRAVSRRISLIAAVAAGTDLDRARATALDAIKGVEGVLEAPAAQFVYGRFDGAAVEFTLHYWIAPATTDFLTAQDGGVVALSRAYAEAAIEVPAPVQALIAK